MFRKIFLSEKNMMIAIVLNAVVIFVMSFPQIHDYSPAFYTLLELIDAVFIVIFVLEAIVKLQTLKAKAYFEDGWNVFDFLIVLVSLPSLLHFIPGLRLVNTSFLKILRLFRLIRLVKFIRFVPRIDSIMAGLTRAIRASVFVIIILFFLNFLLALFTCHFFGPLLPDYFGDPLISSYYIFQIFTVEGWNEIPAAIAAKAREENLPYAYCIAGFARLYFIFVVLIGGIFGMSLANAVFVDEMTMDNNDHLEKKITELQKQVAEIHDLLKKGGGVN